MHAEASARLFGAALWEIPGSLQQVHQRQGLYSPAWSLAGPQTLGPSAGRAATGPSPVAGHTAAAGSPAKQPPDDFPTAQVLPSLREHRDEVLLKELLKRWNNHKVMVRWLSRFFNYLDR